MDVTQSDARRRRDARHLHRGVAVGGGPVAELTLAIIAPTLHRAVVKQGTRVLVSESDAHRLRSERK